jgi:putative transposase
MREVARELPFESVALVLLPDHLHAIWKLPEGEGDYSARWQEIKSRFTTRWLSQGGLEAPVTSAQKRRGNRGVWQKRFWERLVRDEDEFKALLDYIHYNPVKHGHVEKPVEWEWSSFRSWVQRGEYELEWGAGPAERPKYMPKEYE